MIEMLICFHFFTFAVCYTTTLNKIDGKYTTVHVSSVFKTDDKQQYVKLIITKDHDIVEVMLPITILTTESTHVLFTFFYSDLNMIFIINNCERDISQPENSWNHCENIILVLLADMDDVHSFLEKILVNKMTADKNNYRHENVL